MKKDYIIFKKKNGITTTEEYCGTKKAIIEKCNEEHLCWDCANGRTDRCVKIANRTKQNLENYLFITEGYQIIDKETNELEDFGVSKCTSFERDEVRIHTTEEIKRLNALKKDIIAGYFDAEDYDEGTKIHEDLLKRGNLVLRSGKSRR